MSPRRYFIALGSNLGDRKGNLINALFSIQSSIGKLLKVSSLYRSAALVKPGSAEQPEFLNAVSEVESHLEPQELLTELLAIEQQLGRIRDPLTYWQARPIDLDILAMESLVLDLDGLRIPHPEMSRREFVLLPLQEIAPTWAHPVLGKTAAMFLDEKDGWPSCEVYERDWFAAQGLS